MKVKNIKRVMKRYKDFGFKRIKVELKNGRVITVVFNEDKLLWHIDKLFMSNNCFNIAIKYSEIHYISG